MVPPTLDCTSEYEKLVSVTFVSSVHQQYSWLTDGLPAAEYSGNSDRLILSESLVSPKRRRRSSSVTLSIELGFGLKDPKKLIIVDFALILFPDTNGQTVNLNIYNNII
jgi:hypothetical protein